MTILERIYERKRAEIAEAKARTPLADVRRLAEEAGPTRGFRRALVDCGYPLALIAEVKKASPSQGLIRADFDPAQIARAYRDAGAQCLSVLTDVPHFQGSPEYLRIARLESGLPCLRKDFLCDPYQVYEARAWGADAILLIAASLETPLMRDLGALARELQMDVLVEVHADHELDAIAPLGFDLIGVNNRNLATFETDLAISDRLLPRIAQMATAVSESALETKSDLDRVQRAGAQAVLIGTSFCKAPDIVGKVHEVMGR